MPVHAHACGVSVPVCFCSRYCAAHDCSADKLASTLSLDLSLDRDTSVDLVAFVADVDPGALGGADDVTMGAIEAASSARPSAANAAAGAGAAECGGKAVPGVWKQCASGNECYKAEMECDGGDPDCADGTDESPRACAAADKPAEGDAQTTVGASYEEPSSDSSSTATTVAVVASVVVVGIVAGVVYYAKHRAKAAQQLNARFEYAPRVENAVFAGPGDGDLYDDPTQRTIGAAEEAEHVLPVPTAAAEEATCLVPVAVAMAGAAQAPVQYDDFDPASVGQRCEAAPDLHLQPGVPAFKPSQKPEVEATYLAPVPVAPASSTSAAGASGGSTVEYADFKPASLGQRGEAATDLYLQPGAPAFEPGQMPPAAEAMYLAPVPVATANAAAAQYDEATLPHYDVVVPPADVSPYIKLRDGKDAYVPLDPSPLPHLDMCAHMHTRARTHTHLPTLTHSLSSTCRGSHRRLRLRASTFSALFGGAQGCNPQKLPSTKPNPRRCLFSLSTAQVRRCWWR